MMAKRQLLIIHSTEKLRTVVNEVKGEEKGEADLKAACACQRPFSGVNWAEGDVLVVAGGRHTATVARARIELDTEKDARLRWLV